MPRGVYKMIFYTGEYFDQANRATFYPQVEVSAGVTNRLEEIRGRGAGLTTFLPCMLAIDLVPAFRIARSALSHPIVALAVLIYDLPRVLAH